MHTGSKGWGWSLVCRVQSGGRHHVETGVAGGLWGTGGRLLISHVQQGLCSSLRVAEILAKSVVHSASHFAMI